jgi:small subunit ribosomal protein S6
MPLYELGMVVSTDLETEEREAFLAEIRQLLTAGGATFVKEDVWGKRTLAYQIGHKREGYYVFWQYEAPGAVIKPLEYKLKLSDQVHRFLNLNLDNELRRSRKLSKKRAERARKKPAVAQGPSGVGSRVEES